MEKLFQKSLHMIKVLGIKTEKEYNSLHKYCLLLSSESLKYIAQTRDFSKIIDM